MAIELIQPILEVRHIRNAAQLEQLMRTVVLLENSIEIGGTQLSHCCSVSRLEQLGNAQFSSYRLVWT